MNPLVESLGPVFIAGFALQRFLDLIDPILERIAKPHKEWLMGLLALSLSLATALVLDLRALRPFGVTRAAWLDSLLTALLISSGTAWLDDLLKIIRLKVQELQARVAAARERSG